MIGVANLSGSHETGINQLSQAQGRNVSGVMPSPATIGDLLSSEEVSVAFTLSVENCIGLQGPTVKQTYKNVKYPRKLHEGATAAAGITAEQRPHENLERLLVAHREPKGQSGQWFWARLA